MLKLPKKRGASDPADEMQKRFVGALVAIGALIVLFQFVSQWLLAGQQHSAHVISVASRQLLLSQTIAKSGYRLAGVGTTEARRDAQTELREALSLFQQSHAGLRNGSDELGLPGNNSEPVTLMFATLDQDYQAIIGAAGKVLATSDQAGGEMHQALRRLNEHEPGFLAGMGRIVALYEDEAASRIARIRWTGILLTLAMLGALAFAALKIFVPVMKGVQQEIRRHEDLEAEMDKMFSSSPSALFLVDATSLAIERGNLKSEVLMGCSADEFVGRPFSTYFDGRLEANKLFLQRIRIGEIFDEMPVLLVDARNNAVDCMASMRQVTYTGLRRYLIAVTDITESNSSRRSKQPPGKGT